MDNFSMMTDEQRELVELSNRILKAELVPKLAEYEQKGEYPIEVAQKLFDAGLYGLNVPKKYGGLGIDAMTSCIINEEMARIDGGFAFSFTGGSGVMDMLEMCANETQKEYVAKKILEEHTYVGFCLTEPDAGSDAANMRTTAKKEGNEYIINGTKCFATNGGISDIMLVAATLDKNLKHKGITLFLVEKKHGYKAGKKEDKMGLRLSNTTEIIFEDVHIPMENLVGEEGKGFKYAMQIMEHGRPLQMSYAVGIAQAALDYAVKYAKERITFGKPIIKHQGLGFLLADMQASVHAARAMIRLSAELADKGIPLGTLSSSTKFFVSEACMQVTVDAVQVLGGYGFMREYPVEKYMRDIKIFSIFEGTNQINRMVTAGLLEAGQ